MRSTQALSLFLGVAAAAAVQRRQAASDDFVLTSVYTNQPNGAADGQTDYYGIIFTVNRTVGGVVDTDSCSKGWPDNGASNQEAYSVYVPTGQWIACENGFAFQLYPYFSIGNFSIALQQTLPSGAVVESDPYQITNTTSDFTCEIEGDETPPSSGIGQHARGDCTTPNYFEIEAGQNITTPSNFTGFYIPVDPSLSSTTTISTSTSAPTTSITPSSSVTTSAPTSTATCDPDITLFFRVQEATLYGDTLFVVGNTPELGNWNPYTAVALSGEDYSSYGQTPDLWEGGTLSDGSPLAITAGTTFEYKFIRWSENGTLLWECGDNRVYTVPAGSCNGYFPLTPLTDDPDGFADQFHCGFY